MYQISGGGYGGNAGHDGLSNGCSTIGISKSPPVEIMEQAYPVLYRHYALREGSGGAGKHRGGFGLAYEVELLRGEARASFVMDHGRFGPQGAARRRGRRGQHRHRLSRRRAACAEASVQGAGHSAQGRRPRAASARRAAAATATRVSATRNWSAATSRWDTIRRRRPGACSEASRQTPSSVPSPTVGIDPREAARIDLQQGRVARRRRLVPVMRLVAALVDLRQLDQFLLPDVEPDDRELGPLADLQRRPLQLLKIRRGREAEVEVGELREAVPLPVESPAILLPLDRVEEAPAAGKAAQAASPRQPGFVDLDRVVDRTPVRRRLRNTAMPTEMPAGKRWRKHRRVVTWRVETAPECSLRSFHPPLTHETLKRSVTEASAASWPPSATGAAASRR